MSFFLPADARSQFPEVTTHFALMTDLHRVFSRCRDDVPGMLLTFNHRLELTRDEGQHGGLLHGSSPTPLGLYAFTVGRHAFYLLLNPLDQHLRPMMEAQRDACVLPCLVSDSKGDFLNMSPGIAAHRVALEDTAGRAPVESSEWLKVAENTVPLLPMLCQGAHKRFRQVKWHHAYFVLPDAHDHPLYSRVN